VITQLQGALPTNWGATLMAVDGAVTADVKRQLSRLPQSATHLVISAGGNDALGHIGILDSAASSSAEVLDELARIQADFDTRYGSMLSEVLQHKLPTTLCTIYRGALPEPGMQRRAGVALGVFNEVILEHAFRNGCDVIDLRAVCDDPRDYANPIEPSERGGEKIARAIATAVTDYGTARRTTVFA
jgi:hypothetical protein